MFDQRQALSAKQACQQQLSDLSWESKRTRTSSQVRSVAEAHYCLVIKSSLFKHVLMLSRFQRFLLHAANAVNAILSVPQTKKAAPLDFLAKEDYGKVPAYLSHIKNEIQAETAMIDEFVREQMGLNNIAPVSQEQNIL
jgi:hypothetical protein